jgi:hypothetical protein
MILNMSGYFETPNIKAQRWPPSRISLKNAGARSICRKRRDQFANLESNRFGQNI